MRFVCSASEFVGKVTRLNIKQLLFKASEFFFDQGLPKSMCA